MRAVEELQSKLNDVMEELDLKIFRPAQKAAFQCSAKCCDLRGSQQEMQQCLDQCGAPIARHQQEVTGELQAFQSRVQRCVTSCQDRQAGAATPDQAAFDKCVSECAVFYQKELGQLKPKLMRKP